MLGAPDVERQVGLTGGHIFQGEVAPGPDVGESADAADPIQGLYLCGAATHPAAA